MPHEPRWLFRFVEPLQLQMVHRSSNNITVAWKTATDNTGIDFSCKAIQKDKQRFTYCKFHQKSHQCSCSNMVPTTHFTILVTACAQGRSCSSAATIDVSTLSDGKTVSQIVYWALWVKSNLCILNQSSKA